MPQGMDWIGGYQTPPPVVTTTWNPSDKNADITLSGGDLIAARSTAGGGWRAVRAIASSSSGKKYYEVTMTTMTAGADSLTIGIANSAMSLTVYPGMNAEGIGCSNAGIVYSNSGSPGNATSYTQGNVLCIAVDLSTERAWFRTGSGNWNNAAIGSQDPGNGVGGYDFSPLNAGPYFPAFCHSAQNDSYVANFGATAYAQTPPSGFGNW